MSRAQFSRKFSMRNFIIRAVVIRDEALVRMLHTVWDRSVRATHTFLSDAQITSISACIPGYIAAVPHLVAAFDADDRPYAFMGVCDRKIEMLFIDPDVRGCGLGRRLVGYAVGNYSVDLVCVNEQNTQACGFYEHLGFRVERRTERDEQGRPFPLLHLRVMPG